MLSPRRDPQVQVARHIFSLLPPRNRPRKIRHLYFLTFPESSTPKKVLEKSIFYKLAKNPEHLPAPPHHKEALVNHHKALQTTQSIKTSTHQEPTAHSNQAQQKIRTELIQTKIKNKKIALSKQFSSKSKMERNSHFSCSNLLRSREFIRPR